MALALAIAAGSLLLWLVNPFAGLLAVPAAHLWMLTVVTRPAPPRRLRAVLIGLGVAPAVLVAIYYLFALNLDPLHGAWYLLMLVTGHSVGIVLALIGCLMLARRMRHGRDRMAPARRGRGRAGAAGTRRLRPRLVRRTGLARRHSVGAPALTGRMSGFRDPRGARTARRADTGGG